MNKHHSLVRRAAVALAALVASSLAAPASAAPSESGWRDGWCKQGEGMTVVVDFGDHSERAWEARCRIGGDYQATTGDGRVDPLEAVGYDVTLDGGLVTYIDGIGDDVWPWWMYSVAHGGDAWSTTSYTLPEGERIDWFLGVCLSEAGCYPRVDPQFLPDDNTDPEGPGDPEDPTETPKALSVPRVAVAKKPTSKATGRVRVTVPRAAGRVKATGKVVLTLRRGGKVVTRRAQLGAARPVAVIVIPRLAKGRWKLVVTYRGDASYRRATGTTSLVVAR